MLSHRVVRSHGRPTHLQRLYTAEQAVGVMTRIKEGLAMLEDLEPCYPGAGHPDDAGEHLRARSRRDLGEASCDSSVARGILRSMKGDVRAIRVDLPSANPRWKGSFAMFFIEAKWGADWHPWWSTLFRFLLELERSPDAVNPTGVEMEVALLTGRKRQEFLELLQAAPESVVAGHRTLRSALRQLPQHDLDLPVRYFGPLPEAPSGG